jgi:hypothetical protein
MVMQSMATGRLYVDQNENLGFYSNQTNQELAGCQWLTPVILATWEAESRRNVVQSQQRQIV